MSEREDNVNRSDAEAMTNQLQKLQEQGFNPRVSEGQIIIEGQFSRIFDFKGNTITTFLKPCIRR
jgi:hypothetical protein